MDGSGCGTFHEQERAVCSLRFKRDLQVATVEAARSIFIREVIRPSFEGEHGLVDLGHLCEYGLGYVGSGVFRGGCFFEAVAA